MSRRRVVITGIGIVSPIGCTSQIAWTNVLKGFCGISKLPDDLYGKLPCRVAGQIKKEDLNVENHFTKSELIAAKEALEMSKWFPEQEEKLQKTGVCVGMGMIDLNDVCETNEALKKGYNRVNPFFVPRILPNMASGQISIKYGFRGPNHSVSTACATGVHSLGDASRFIRHGDADIMVSGAAEACISPLAIAGFSRLRALSTSIQ